MENIGRAFWQGILLKHRQGTLWNFGRRAGTQGNKIHIDKHLYVVYI
jgi:hypothetical protein